MFKWACLGLGVVAVGAVLWMLNDLRLELRRVTTTVNERLPEIVAKADRTADTVAELAEDVRQLKELAGVTAKVRDESLVGYANSVMDFLEKSNGTIGIKKLIGSGLKDTEPAKEWSVGGRKKALVLTALASSREDFLDRLADKWLGTKWYIQVGNAEPALLSDWVKANHPESKDLK